MIADKAAVNTASGQGESAVRNHDGLQARQLINAQFALSGRADDPAPALDAVVGRRFTFDRVGRFGILEQQKRRGPAQQIRVRFADMIRRDP